MSLLDDKKQRAIWKADAWCWADREYACQLAYEVYEETKDPEMLALLTTLSKHDSPSTRAVASTLLSRIKP